MKELGAKEITGITLAATYMLARLKSCPTENQKKKSIELVQISIIRTGLP